MTNCVKDFDPSRDIPTNDEQAEIALRWNKDEGFAAVLILGYGIRRSAGESVLDAYKHTLLQAVGKPAPEPPFEKVD